MGSDGFCRLRRAGRSCGRFARRRAGPAAARPRSRTPVCRFVPRWPGQSRGRCGRERDGDDLAGQISRRRLTADATCPAEPKPVRRHGQNPEVSERLQNVHRWESLLCCPRFAKVDQSHGETHARLGMRVEHDHKVPLGGGARMTQLLQLVRAAWRGQEVLKPLVYSRGAPGPAAGGTRVMVTIPRCSGIAVGQAQIDSMPRSRSRCTSGSR